MSGIAHSVMQHHTPDDYQHPQLHNNENLKTNIHQVFGI
jgi:hypothetical protein